MSVFLSGLARLVVVLHSIAAMALVGAATHHVIVALGFLRGTYKVRLAKIYAATTLGAWLVTFALGLLAYPAFRYGVRALYLDANAPWATRLFDLKEYFAALGLPIVAGVLALSRVIEPKLDRVLVRAYAAMVALIAAIVWFDVITGLVITMEKGV
jgi:hypothetical protein